MTSTHWTREGQLNQKDSALARPLFTRRNLLLAQIDGLADLRSTKQHNNNMPGGREAVNTPAPPLPYQSPLSFPSAISVSLQTPTPSAPTHPLL